MKEWILIFLFSAAGFVLLLNPSSIEAKASKKQLSGSLNLNTASVEQLDELPSISPKKAEEIVNYRKEHPFKTVEDLDNVKGFTPKSIEKLKAYIAVDGSNSLKVEGKKSSHKKHGAQKSGKKSKKSEPSEKKK